MSTPDSGFKIPVIDNDCRPEERSLPDCSCHYVLGLVDYSLDNVSWLGLKSYRSVVV